MTFKIVAKIFSHFLAIIEIHKLALFLVYANDNVYLMIFLIGEFAQIVDIL